MADTGWKSPGTVANDASVGTVAWINMDNVKVSDNNRAYANPLNTDDVSHYLKATNFDFSVPDGALINGILVEIEKTSENSNEGIRDYSIKIVKSDGSLGTVNKKKNDSWPTMFDEVISQYGASVDLWDESWSASDLNNSNFGVVISAYNNNDPDSYAYIDHIKIKVYYTITTTSPLPTFKRPQ